MLYRALTGWENLELFDQLHGGPRLGRAKRIEALIEEVGLSEASMRPAGTYSRGMQQRLALARALLASPMLLLLDEPFSGLDQGASLRCHALIEARRRAGALVLLVTHDLSAATRLADRALILRRGRLSWSGPLIREGSVSDTDGALPLLEAYRRYA